MNVYGWRIEKDRGRDEARWDTRMITRIQHPLITLCWLSFITLWWWFGVDAFAAAAAVTSIVVVANDQQTKKVRIPRVQSVWSEHSSPGKPSTGFLRIKSLAAYTSWSDLIEIILYEFNWICCRYFIRSFFFAITFSFIYSQMRALHGN